MQRGPVALVRDGDVVRAFEAQCPHGAVDLVEGTVRRGVITCLGHGARFRLEDGKLLRGPGRRPLEVYRAVVDGDDVVVSSGLPEPCPAYGWRSWLTRRGRRPPTAPRSA